MKFDGIFKSTFGYNYFKLKWVAVLVTSSIATMTVATTMVNVLKAISSTMIKNTVHAGITTTIVVKDFLEL